jgi:hypothetical protein
MYRSAFLPPPTLATLATLVILVTLATLVTLVTLETLATLVTLVQQHTGPVRADSRRFPQYLSQRLGQQGGL